MLLTLFPSRFTAAAWASAADNNCTNFCVRFKVNKMVTLDISFFCDSQLTTEAKVELYMCVIVFIT
jgi:hypothetical protein